MLRPKGAVLLTFSVAVLLVAGGSVWTAFARQDYRDVSQTFNAIRERDARQLLQMMDTDKDGKVSKQEFMQFMEDEFNRLDKDMDGELDMNELKVSNLQPNSFSPTGN